jgi:hypothetical protein
MMKSIDFESQYLYDMSIIYSMCSLLGVLTSVICFNRCWGTAWHVLLVEVGLGGPDELYVCVKGGDGRVRAPFARAHECPPFSSLTTR